MSCLHLANTNYNTLPVVALNRREPQDTARVIYCRSGRTVTPMSDARIEAFLADVLALEGENQDAIREGVHIALVDCEQIFKAQEVNRRMKDKAGQVCHALCRS